MDRLEPEERAQGEAPPAREPLSLSEWHRLGRPAGRDLQLSCADALDNDYPDLARARSIVIEFPAFTDGRGFSHARRLRGEGFGGELLAAGDVLPDQWSFLQRCGFTGFADPALSGEARERPSFRHGYQADEKSPGAATVRS
jgi:uncharacterized protein (DUF934 family)